MINILIILALLLFMVGLLLRMYFPRLCAVCFSVSAAWISLIVMKYVKEIFDPIAFSLLIGASLGGSVYYLSSKLPAKYHGYKFPYIFTVFTLLYFLIIAAIPSLKTVLLLSSIWLIFIVIMNAVRYKKLALKLIECCRNW